MTLTLPAALTAQLAYSVGPGFRQGRNAWWMDATAADGTILKAGATMPARVVIPRTE